MSQHVSARGEGSHYTGRDPLYDRNLFHLGRRRREATQHERDHTTHACPYHRDDSPQDLLQDVEYADRVAPGHPDIFLQEQEVPQNIPVSRNQPA